MLMASFYVCIREFCDFSQTCLGVVAILPALETMQMTVFPYLHCAAFSENAFLLPH